MPSRAPTGIAFLVREESAPGRDSAAVARRVVDQAGVHGAGAVHRARGGNGGGDGVGRGVVRWVVQRVLRVVVVEGLEGRVRCRHAEGRVCEGKGGRVLVGRALGGVAQGRQLIQGGGQTGDIPRPAVISGIGIAPTTDRPRLLPSSPPHVLEALVLLLLQPKNILLVGRGLTPGPWRPRAAGRQPLNRAGRPRGSGVGAVGGGRLQGRQRPIEARVERPSQAPGGGDSGVGGGGVRGGTERRQRVGEQVEVAGDPRRLEVEGSQRLGVRDHAAHLLLHPEACHRVLSLPNPWKPMGQLRATSALKL